MPDSTYHATTRMTLRQHVFTKGSSHANNESAAWTLVRQAMANHNIIMAIALSFRHAVSLNFRLISNDLKVIMHEHQVLVIHVIQVNMSL